jgi:hypothetical protein
MKKIIPASYHRNEYNKTTFEEAIVYTVTLGAAAAQQVTNISQVSFGLSAVFSATAKQLSFDNLWGNIPWSSYSKFTNTNPRTTEPPLPLASLPNAGSVVITEGGIGTETIYYGSVTWTPAAGPLPATTGTLNNIKRGATPLAFTAAATCTFVTGVPVREYFFFWNRTGGTLYIGYDGTVNNTPTNALTLADDGTWGVWLEPLQNIWLYSAAGGNVNISEYR